jgi:hypothetical protein
MNRFVMHTLFPALMLLPGTGCGAQSADDVAQSVADVADGSVCRPLSAGTPLPAVVYETSGLALSTHDPEILWTHNDRGHDPVLYAVRSDGRLVAQVRVTGAESVDWEDIEMAPCSSGSGSCLYVADIGDNNAVRAGVTIYEVPEPSLDAGVTAPARALHARYPDGAHNAESLFILPGGDMYIITKGDAGPVTLYRYPMSARGERDVVLERVRDAMTRPQGRMQYVTGATTSPDGSRVAIRTYGSLHFYASDNLVSGAPTEPVSVDIRALREEQGEGVAFGEDGTVWLSSEAESGGSAVLARLECDLPD